MPENISLKYYIKKKKKIKTGIAEAPVLRSCGANKAELTVSITNNRCT